MLKNKLLTLITLIIVIFGYAIYSAVQLDNVNEKMDVECIVINKTNVNVTFRQIDCDTTFTVRYEDTSSLPDKSEIVVGNKMKINHLLIPNEDLSAEEISYTIKTFASLIIGFIVIIYTATTNYDDYWEKDWFSPITNYIDVKKAKRKRLNQQTKEKRFLRNRQVVERDIIINGKKYKYTI